MKTPWPHKGHEEPPVLRPQEDRPITEFEIKRLEQAGVWLTIRVQVTPRGSWVNWKHDIPEDLRKEAREALEALTRNLQDRD